MEDCNTALFRYALDLYRKESYQELFSFCEKAVKSEPENFELWKLFGVGAGMSKNSEIAVLCHERVISLEPNNEHNIMNLITAYFHDDKAEVAIEYIHQIKDRFSDNMVLRLKETLAQAKGHYDVNQVISYLPKNIQKKLADTSIS